MPKSEKSFKSSLGSVLIELGEPANGLIVDLFCSSDFAIPVYNFVAISAAFLAFSFYLPTLDQEVEGEFVDLLEPIRIPGCSSVRPDDLVDPARNQKTDEYKSLLICVSRLPLSAGFILNSWEDLEPIPLKALRENPFFKKPNIFPVGPIIKSKEYQVIDDSIPDQCLAWLDKQPVESIYKV
ncbi:hydroquinone glucosyltransferase-like [Rutidosis leptorrhynchoides]|uniref:hydroquinone glucosyltransferase-like n=1 Tax=Rutidosis leptorrhynchoides TaxID=125765 RepID=UPI003A996C80